MDASKQTKDMRKDGAWLLDTSTLTLTWMGELPVPRITFRQRCAFAWIYFRSVGTGSRFIDCRMRLAKAVAFCMKPPQVSWSGKPNETVGRSIEEAWNSFNLTVCGFPQSGHGNPDNLEARAST